MIFHISMFASILLLSALGFIQEAKQPDLVRPSVPIHTFAQPPQIDGDLSDWAALTPIQIDQQFQCNRFPGNPLSQNWAGPQDASARIWFGATASDFLIAGEIQDDSHVDPIDPWWHGDAVELFLCFRPGEGEKGTFDDDDYQIFLMPLRQEGRWGAWIQGGLIGPGDSSFYGVRVEGRRQGEGYVFEAAFPWANFPSFQTTTREIGANIAIDDADGKAGFPKNYLVWTGDVEVYRDSSRMARLTLPAQGLEMPQPFLGAGIFQELLFVVAGLLSIGLLFGFAKMLYSRFRKGMAFPRWAGIFTLGLILSLLATAALRKAIERAAMRDLDPAIETVRETLRDISRGGMGPVGGAEFGDRLSSLLSGKEVDPKASIRYTALPVGEPAPLGVTRRLGIPFFRFDRPILAGAPLVFECRGEQKVSSVAIAIEADAGFASSERGEARQTPAIHLSLQHPAGSPTRVDLAWEQAKRDSWKGETQTVLVWTVALESEAAISRVEILASGFEQASARFQGVSWKAAGAWTAETLGFIAQTGVPVAVGPQPPAAAGWRFAPGSGESRELALPAGEESDRIFLLATLEADEPSTGKDYGAALLEVRAVRAENGEESAFTLRRDIDLHPWNLDRSPHLPDMESRVAFRWEDKGVRRHLDLCEIRLPAKARWSKLRLRELGADSRNFALRILGATMGVSVPAGPAPSLVPASNGKLRLAPESLSRLAGIRFEFFAQRPSLQFEDVLLRGEIRPFFRQGTQGESVAGALLPVRDGERIVGALEISRQDDGAGSWKKIVGLLPFLVACLLFPFLLLSAASALGGLGRLRSQLLGAFLMTSVLPLLLLLVFLSDLLLGRYRSAEEESLRAALAASEQKVLGMKSQVSQASYAFAQAFLDHPRIRDLLSHPERPDYEAALRGEISRMRPSLLAGEGSFLHFEEIDASTQGIRRLAISEGVAAEDLRRFSFAEASFFESRGALRVAGVHRVQEGGRRFVFVAGATVASEPPEGFMGRIYSPSGYPLEGLGLDDAERSLSRVARIREISATGAQSQRAAIDVATLGGAPCQIALRPIRNAEGAPASYLALAKPRSEYLLQFGITEIPLRRGLVLFGGLVLIGAFVVVRALTSRITRPIERLERGARSIRGGEIPAPVAKETQDEIGALTESFNEMADALRRRLQELASLHQGLREMSACLSPEPIAAEAGRLLRRSLQAERFLLLLPGQGGAAAEIVKEEGGAEWIVEGSEPLRALLDGGDLLLLSASQDRPAFLPPCAVVAVVPLQLRGAKRGCMIVGLNAAPDSAQREFLQAVAGQLAIALENARFYRLAIEDPTTGAYNGNYFRGRLAEEIAAAKEKGEPLSLLRISLKELEISLQRGRSPQTDAALEKVGGTLRRVAPRGCSIGRAGLGDFHLALPGVAKERALALAAELRRELSDPGLLAGSLAKLSLRPKIAVASFPDDGQSADFLLLTLDPAQAMGRRATSGVYDVRERPESVRVETASGETVFRSPKMLEILGIVERIANSDLPVLLHGETGVGKEIVADLVQQQSARADKPYIKINCAAIPEALLESELFGSERGAYTGASERRIGRFEAAHGGTVFLDEVGELPLAVQAKLLRVLQEKKVTRLGGSSPVEADFRILAATNRDLFLAVSQGSFRSDLFYRLQGISLAIPPLRERREEIGDLVELVRQRFCRREGREVTIPAATQDLLFHYGWPGNVRELFHVVEKGLLLATHGVLDTSLVMSDLAPLPRAAALVSQIPASMVQAALSERQVKLIRHLVHAEVVTTVQYVEIAEVSRRTALRDLDELVQKGLLERSGKRRAAHYRLVSRPKN